MKKRFIALLLATLILLSVTACTNPVDDPGNTSAGDVPPELESLPEPSVVDIDRFFGMTEMPDIPDVPVATLDGYTVLRSDYAFFFYILRSNMEYGADVGAFSEDEKAEFWDSEVGEDGTTAREFLKTNTLNAAKELAVIHALAVENGTEPDEMANQQSDFEVLSFLSQYGSNEQEFASVYQMTSQQLREANHRMNLMLKFMEESMEEFTISEIEIRNIYDAVPEYYDTVTVRHVFISCTDSMSPEEQAIAKLTADEVFQMLKDGADIGELAYYYSEDPSSQYQNGEYTFARDQTPQELEDWSFSAKQGDQDLIKTDYGYHIIELVTPAGYAFAKEEIAYDLRTEMFYQSIESQLELVYSPDWVLNQEVIDSITV